MCTLKRTHGTKERNPSGPNLKDESLEGLKSIAWLRGRKSAVACFTNLLKFANSVFRDILAVNRFSICGLVSTVIPPQASKTMNSSSHEIPWASCAAGLNSKSWRKDTTFIIGRLRTPYILECGLATVKVERPSEVAKYTNCVGTLIVSFSGPSLAGVTCIVVPPIILEIRFSLVTVNLLASSMSSMKRLISCCRHILSFSLAPHFLEYWTASGPNNQREVNSTNRKKTVLWPHSCPYYIRYYVR